jgi:hypothetical protein
MSSRPDQAYSYPVDGKDRTNVGSRFTSPVPLITRRPFGTGGGTVVVVAVVSGTVVSGGSVVEEDVVVVLVSEGSVVRGTKLSVAGGEAEAPVEQAPSTAVITTNPRT